MGCLQKFNTASDQRVSCSILILVPAVCSANLNPWERLLNVVDAGQEFRPGEVPSVECLRTDSDGVDGALELGYILL